MIIKDLTNFEFVTHYAYASTLIMIIILIYLFVERLVFFRRSRIFASLIILALVETLVDILNAKLFNYYGVNGELLPLIGFIQNTYLFLLYLSFYGFFIYIIDITIGLDYFNKEKEVIFCLSISFIISEVFVLINYFYPVLFSFDIVNNQVSLVVNMPMLILSILLAGGNFVAIFFLMYRYREIYDWKQIFPFVIILILMVTGILIQLTKPEYLLVSLMISLCFCIVQTVLETSEDMVYENTLFYNYSEFNRNIKRIFINQTDKRAILARIVNYHDLIKQYSAKDTYLYLSDITTKLNKKTIAYKLRDDMYYLDNGLFAWVGYYSLDKKEKIFNIIESVRKEKSYCFNFNPIIKFCELDIINDFSSPDDLDNFVANYRTTIDFPELYTIYGFVKDDKDLIIQNHIDEIMDTALRENEFEVYYQPIYSIKDKKYKTSEALIRLFSKKYGFISPEYFIPYAERSGKIKDIDNYVMEKVFSFVGSNKFKELGLEYIEINLSVVECLDDDLISRIHNLIDKYNVNPNHINLEITESFDSSEQKVITDTINELVKLGFRFSIDDYGTGYSNINRVSTLPITIVKIDKSLVDSCNDPDIKKILNYSFNIIKDLNKESVVEGVETKEQLEVFKEYGATYIQGYYFSKPLKFSEYLEFLKNN